MLRLRLPLAFLLLLLLTWLSLPLRAEIITAPVDTREYRYLQLENGLRVVVISDPRTDKAAVSLNVSVGSNANPAERPGLAHFLEHMLFLGTEKYPEADSYQKFISSQGGSHNAFTAYENTNYFFDVEASALPEALDRFAQFFIAPLFTAEYVDRERHAVHSEYQAKLREDSRRSFEAQKQVLNPEHHYSRFAVGSLETLANSDDSHIRHELIEFYKRYYSANLMTLAMIGPQPVEQLESLARRAFSAVENRNAAPFVDQAPLFVEGRLPAQLNIETLRETRLLSLSFPMPPIREHWQQKPLYYLSSLIGYEGSGSLLSLLKEKGWVRSLSASPALDLPGQAMFQIQMELTEAGWNAVDQIATDTFAFIETLRQEGINAELFAEERQLAEVQFRFRMPGDPVHEVMRLSQALQHYPVPYLLKADYYFGEFDAELIQHYLDQMRPDNLLLTLEGQDLPTDQVEPRYQTAYSIKPIDEARLALWQAPEMDERLHVRKRNPYVADKLELIATEDFAHPQAIWSKPGSVLWYLPDNEFQRPKADFYFSLLSPVANQSAHNTMLAHLYTRMVMDQLNEPLYDAALAGLGVSLYPHMQGISLKLSGFSDKQPLLLETLVTAMRNPILDETRFDRIHDQLREELENSAQEKPYNQAFNHLYNHLVGSWTREQKLTALKSINIEDLQQFYPRLLEPAGLRLLAHGNLSKDTAITMAQQVSKTLQPAQLGWLAEPPHVLSLPESEPLIDTFLTEHGDASALLYLQGPDEDLRTRAAVALISEIASTPFYSRLRTEKQYGYIVFANFLPVRERAGMALVVQSPNTDPFVLATEYNRFLQDISAMLAKISKEELQRYKQSLLSRINQRDTNLNERTERYWRELDRENFEFDTRARLSEHTLSLSREELSTMMESLMSRQLLVRNFGTTVEENVKQQAQLDDDVRLNALKHEQLGLPLE
ncbi:insulinase family protein [Marinobacterium sediminicola]|uniref:Protease 3 n=1 Tax=Marinobacterium sediminicola TaxID=518898 RepID=A0ABY1RX19_9GAMM|nr:insulinase family protein [Marinobacterium sediminicola]ULG70244.1 insulinase family protein [Marinobacterium sediminicola]SMR69976.1 Secreted Zn-dependent peptidases, insulinase-like [Marinobacterium sediminicola]